MAEASLLSRCWPGCSLRPMVPASSSSVLRPSQLVVSSYLELPPLSLPLSPSPSEGDSDDAALSTSSSLSLSPSDCSLLPVADANTLPLPPSLSTCVWTYSIVFHATWRCPVLYFSTSPPLSRSAVLRHLRLPPDSVPPPGGECGVLDGSYGLVSMEDHPASGHPSYYLHPCQTRDVLSAMRSGCSSVQQSVYCELLSFLSVALPSAGYPYEPFFHKRLAAAIEMARKPLDDLPLAPAVPAANTAATAVDLCTPPPKKSWKKQQPNNDSRVVVIDLCSPSPSAGVDQDKVAPRPPQKGQGDASSASAASAAATAPSPKLPPETTDPDATVIYKNAEEDDDDAADSDVEFCSHQMQGLDFEEEALVESSPGSDSSF